MGSALTDWLNKLSRSQLNGLFYLASLVLVALLAGIAFWASRQLLTGSDGWLVWVGNGVIGLVWLVVSGVGVLYLSLVLQGK